MPSEKFTIVCEAKDLPEGVKILKRESVLVELEKIEMSKQLAGNKMIHCSGRVGEGVAGQGYEYTTLSKEQQKTTDDFWQLCEDLIKGTFGGE